MIKLEHTLAKKKIPKNADRMWRGRVIAAEGILHLLSWCRESRRCNNKTQKNYDNKHRVVPWLFGERAVQRCSVLPSRRDPAHPRPLKEKERERRNGSTTEPQREKRSNTKWKNKERFEGLQRVHRLHPVSAETSDANIWIAVQLI